MHLQGKHSTRPRSARTASALLAAVVALGLAPVPLHAADDKEPPYILISAQENTFRARTGVTSQALFQHTEARKVIEWAMEHSPITVLEEGTYVLSDMVRVPRPNVSLVIKKKAVLRMASKDRASVITEGRGGYYTLIYNRGHDNVKVVNLGTLDFTCGIIFDGRSGGKCGIDGGLIFSVGPLLHSSDAIWIVDAKNVRVPMVFGDGPGPAALTLEGCEDLEVGTVLAIGDTMDEAVDMNAYCRRVHVGWAIGKNVNDAVMELNNSPDCVIEKVTGYGTGRLLLVGNTEVPHGSRRLTQMAHLPDSSGSVVKEKNRVAEAGTWRRVVEVPALPEALPRFTVRVKLMGNFEDGEKVVLDETYDLNLGSP